MLFPPPSTEGIDSLGPPRPRRARRSDAERRADDARGLPGDIITVFEGRRWVNRVIGGRPLPGRFGSRFEAVAVGEETARRRRVGHVVVYSRQKRPRAAEVRDDLPA
jgi:hypothetical protein